MVKGDKDMRLSARNQFKGKVVKITPGAVNTEVVVELPGGQHIVSIITKASAESLELGVGKTAYAVIKASNVMIGVD
jgi:molybdopterin-binding protein